MAASLSFFESITRSSPVGIYTTDDHGDCTWVNERWCELTGLTPEQAFGGGWSAALHPEDRQRVHDEWYRCATDGVPFSLEYRFQTPDGHVNWVYGTAERLTRRDGTPQGFVGCVWDATERKRAEQTMQRVVDAVTPVTGLDFFRSLANQVCLACHVDYVLVDTVEDTEPGRVRALAFSHRGELVENFAYDLRNTPCQKVLDASFCHYATDVQRAFPFDRDLAALGADSYMGISVTSASGRVLGLIALIHGKPIPSPRLAETVLRVVAARAAAEMERELAERALRHSEELLRGLVETSPFPMLVTSLPEERILLLNRRFTEVFGYTHREVGSAEEWWPLAYRDPVYRERIRSLWKDRVRQAMELPGIPLEPVEAHVTCRDGQERQVEVHMGHYGDRALVVFNDLTDRLRLESELLHGQKMQAVGQLAGGVAHDFNNLLTVINGYCDLLALRTGDPAEVRESVGAIRDAGERASKLTQQLLLFSHKARLEPKVLDLNDVLQQTGAMLRRLIGEHVTIGTVMASHLDYVRIDPSQIEQVVLNLALNARDAMPDGGRLTIETRNVVVDAGESKSHAAREPGRYVELSVSDTGTGMPPSVRARIFEPFFTTKGPGRGTGLGLATVYGIVQQNGGFIDVSSEVGAGSRFAIGLPSAGNQAADDGPRDADDLSTLRGGETILLVEDEDAVRRVARLALEMRGYTVIEACSGSQAIARLSSAANPVDLVLTDVVMPEMSGHQLVERLRLPDQRTRVLFMSGYDRERAGGTADGEDILQKPFTPTALARKVRDVLDGAV